LTVATRIAPASRARLGLAPGEFAILTRLSTPERIQAFLNAVPSNHEPDGPTIHSVRAVLRTRRAHCIEGAFVAACALWIHGERPLVMHLDCATSDHPHVIALYRRHGHWGAISKSNGAVLRFRDAVYRSLRELALSYFHEYFDKRGRKTLRSYSQTLDLRRMEPALWVTAAGACQVAHDAISELRHYPLISTRQAAALARRDAFERAAARIVEHPRAN
jgi:hypothetical protein